MKWILVIITLMIGVGAEAHQSNEGTPHRGSPKFPALVHADRVELLPRTWNNEDNWDEATYNFAYLSKDRELTLNSKDLLYNRGTYGFGYFKGIASRGYFSGIQDLGPYNCQQAKKFLSEDLSQLNYSRDGEAVPAFKGHCYIIRVRDKYYSVTALFEVLVHDHQMRGGPGRYIGAAVAGITIGNIEILERSY